MSLLSSFSLSIDHPSLRAICGHGSKSRGMELERGKVELEIHGRKMVCKRVIIPEMAALGGACLMIKIGRLY